MTHPTPIKDSLTVNISALDINKLTTHQRIMACNEFRRGIHYFEDAGTICGNFKLSNVSQVSMIIDFTRPECIVSFGAISIDTIDINNAPLTLDQIITQLTEDQKLLREIQDKFEGKSIWSFPKHIQFLKISEFFEGKEIWHGRTM